ncbi:hypothetical protein [Schumannella soli]|uniref:Uncharacterized protein n=1 Tax=Schumannella soli TaxID=2590779 RepID=A0A506Y073_9MICO|nr:hypothetical protein [Schumannella soli]TPW75425.1 hypothetical protein FJ657_05875 [Schumannella soli]
MTNRPIRMLGAGAALLFALSGCSMLSGPGGPLTRSATDAGAGAGAGTADGCPGDAAATVRRALERRDPSRDFAVSVIPLEDAGPDVYQIDEDTNEESTTTIGAIVAEAVDDACAIEFTVDEIDSFQLLYVPDSDGVAEAIADSLHDHGFWDDDVVGIADLPDYTDDQYVVSIERLASGSDTSTIGLGVEKDARYADGVIVLAVVFGG